jgi:Zn-dependent peptidase ImmA (M78 family)
MFIKRTDSNDYEPIQDSTRFLSNGSKKSISDLAEKIRNHFKSDIKNVIRELGGKIDKVKFNNKSIDGAIYVSGSDNFNIKLYDEIMEERQNFTLAHELGHYILHTNFGRKVDELKQQHENLQAVVFKRDENNHLEAEANYFAGSFLMPENEFREKWKLYQDNYVLSAEFNVSARAVRVRKQVLGID